MKFSAVCTVLKNAKALAMGRLLSVTLLFLSSIWLFFTVIFVAIPSAKVRVWPKTSLVSHTANVVLVRSGAVLDFAPRNVLPLKVIRSDVEKSMRFTEISRKFLGQNARTQMTIINETNEPYDLRSGTRLVNQAGMIFRIEQSVRVPPATQIEPGTVRVRAEAKAKDLYGDIIGERGNVPAGLKWEIPGLPLDERKFVYARNALSGTGGTSAFGTELTEDDLGLAQKQLKQELIKTAKELTEDKINNLRANTGKLYTLLQYEVLTNMSSSGVSLPRHLLGQSVDAIPVHGWLSYEMLAYSKNDLFDILIPGLKDHIDDKQELIEGSAVMAGLSVHVIEYDDDLNWVKITAELTGKQRHILSQTSISGREFGERVRLAIKGKSIRDAERIIQNFPEVDRVEISTWPPWRHSVPSLSGNIAISPQ